jgi:hypothetical protein
MNKMNFLHNVVRETGDRELLERAARAAGIPGAWDEPACGFYLAFELRGPQPVYVEKRRALGVSTDNRVWWDPLIDVGDAFRLAVRLDMSMEFDAGGLSALAFVPSPVLGYGARQVFGADYRYCGGDKVVAMQRAIVLAAAGAAP